MVAISLPCPGAPAAGRAASRSSGRSEAAPFAPGELGRPALKVYSDSDGLPNSTIQAITFDRKGLLWVATQDGAAWYDGHAWNVVNMPNRSGSNYVRAIRVAHDGSIWFGRQYGGVARLRDGEWTTFAEADGLSNGRVNALLETRAPDGGWVLWAGTYGGGVCRQAKGTWSVFRTAEGLPDDRVWALGEVTGDDGKALLLVGTEGGVAAFDGKRWVPFRPGLVPRGVSVNSFLETKAADGRRTLFIGCFGTGVLELTDGRVTTHDTSKGLPSNFVTGLSETISARGESIVWAGTASGLARLEHGRWSVLDTRRGLTAPEVYSLCPAEDGSLLWIGTRGGGLVRLAEGKWVTFDQPLGLPGNQIYSIREMGPKEARRLWVGTSGGVAYLEGDEWRRVDASSGLPGNQVSSVAETAEGGKRTIWVGTWVYGAGRFDGTGWTTLNARRGFISNRISRLLASTADDGSPVLWVATDGAGLGRLEKGRWTRWDTRDGLPGDTINALFETKASRRTIWLGTRAGAARLDGEKLVPLDRASDPPANDIQDFGEVVLPDGHHELWAATRGGIARRSLANGAAGWKLLSDGTVPALPTNLIYFVRQDRDGRVYLGTNKGIVRLTPKSPTPEDPSEFDLYVYTTEDGLPTNACTWAATVDDEGRIWAGTMAGVALLDPREERSERRPKPLRIEAVEIGGQRRFLPDGASLSYRENSLELSYALQSYFSERSTRYRTQLAGFDPAPSRWVAEPRRQYTNLPAGSYRFRVWGRDYAGNVSGPVELAFAVRAAPWGSWWAIALYAMGAFFALIGVARLSADALRRRNEELEAKVRERTLELAHARDEAVETTKAKSAFLANVSHELRTPLNAIIGYSELLLDEAAERHLSDFVLDLTRIRTAAHHQLGLINEVLDLSKVEAGRMELHLTRFDLEDLLRDVTSTLEPLAARNGDRLEVATPRDLRPMLGDPTRLKQILLNLLGNAVKFTENGLVSVEVVLERPASGPEYVVLTVRDTGIGMTPEQVARLFQPFEQAAVSTSNRYPGTGLGLALSRRFCQMMGGDIQVASQPGEGTTVTVRLPVEVARRV